MDVLLAGTALHQPCNTNPKDTTMTLQQILDAIAALDENLTAEDRAAAVTEIIAGIGADVTPTERAELLAGLRVEALAAVDAILDGELTDDSTATLTVIREANAAILSEITAIEEAETERAETAQRLAQEIRGEDPTPDGDPEEDEPAEDAPVEDEPVVPAEGEPATDEEPAPATGERQPVAASARQAQARRAAARRPRSVQLPAARGATPGELPSDITEWGLVASANAGSMVAGTPVRTREDLSEAVLAAVAASRNYTQGPPVNVPLFRIGGTGTFEELRALGYDDDRILTRDYQRNEALIQRACSEQAVMAAGGFDTIQASLGICAPQQVRYDLPTLGDDGRPLRDQALTRFGADRGGIRTLPPVILEDVEDSVGVWTNTIDENPGSETKPCLSLTCPDDEESLVAAITRCLEIGNFRSRFFGEQVEAWLRMAGVWHARVAERRLFDQIAAASTQVTSSQILGTVPDILSDLDLATAGIRSSRRLSNDMPLRWVIPAWLINQMRADQARSMPAGSADERFALSEESIRRWLAVRRVTLTLAMDGPAGQEFPRQGDGPLIGWPTTAVSLLYPDGAHLFLDGGELDLGIVRDSGLNSTNDFQMFAETFEGHHYHGDVSYEITHDICPSGTRAALADSTGVCTAGS